VALIFAVSGQCPRFMTLFRRAREHESRLAVYSDDDDDDGGGGDGGGDGGGGGGK
jgi:hypothetical protein